MTDQLPDRWHTRDLPVLMEVARHLDEGVSMIESRVVAEALELDPDQVNQAYDALMPAYVEGKLHRAMGHGVVLATATRLTERGRRATGLWPDGDTAVEQLLSALRQAEDLTQDEEEKTALRKAGGQLATVSRSVIAEVIAAVVTRQAGL